MSAKKCFLALFGVFILIACATVYIQIDGKWLYIYSFKKRNIFMLKSCLRLNSKLINTKVNEFYIAYDKALVEGDLTMLELLEPYNIKFNYIENKSAIEPSGAISECIRGGYDRALEYLLINDLIRLKAYSPSGGSYNLCLDDLLAVSNCNNYKCNRLLIQYGANPLYENLNGIIAVIDNCPNFLEDYYRFKGIESFVKFKELFKRKVVSGNKMENIKSFLDDFIRNNNDIPESDLKYIKNLRVYLEKEYSCFNVPQNAPIIQIESEFEK